MPSPIDAVFPATSKTDWIAQVNKDLKNDQAYDTLRWLSPEGFVVEPFYTAEDMSTLPLPEMQAAQKVAPGWLNAPAYTVENGQTTAHRDALANGADGLVLRLPKLTAVAELSRVLNGIKLSDTPVFFQQEGQASLFVQDLKTVAPYQLKGGLLTPPDATTVEATQRMLDSPQFRTICVSGHDFHAAGATATQELAFTLARLVDTFDQLTDGGLPVEQIAAKTLLSVSIGTSYFVEIAKLRALRVLWMRAMGCYSLSAAPYPAYIHAQTSIFYESTATPYTNLLRATTEAMSAIIGGCDVLSVRPYDALFEPSEFSQRVARNVSLLLREESYLGKVADPSAGSYYVESLTHQLVESAWTLFLQVETMGGLSKATDFVRTEIDQAYRASVEAVQHGRVLVGVNRFRTDETHEPVQVSNATIVETTFLPDRRIAQSFE